MIKMKKINKKIILKIVCMIIFTSIAGCGNKQESRNNINNNGMDENEFWKIISMFDWEYEGDDSKVINRATNYLSEKTDEDIMKFQDILSKLLYDLDGIEYAKNIGEGSYTDEKVYFSVDDFLYSRCVVVANGKDFYNNILKDPKQMPKDMEFEALLYIACEAYENKNNKEFDYITKYDFETFSNKDKWRK